MVISNSLLGGVDALRQCLLESLGGQVLDGLRDLGRASGVRLGGRGGVASVVDRVWQVLLEGLRNLLLGGLGD
jgi:hypothetical protein